MVASLSREVQTGPFAQAWSEALSGATFEGSDSLSAFISTLLSRKDEAEHVRHLPPSPSPPLEDYSRLKLHCFRCGQALL